MEKHVYVYDQRGDYHGYVRLDTDDTGQEVGEVYSPKADKLGAIRYEALEFVPEESLIFGPEGVQLGHATLETYENDVLGSDIYWIGEDGSDADLALHIHFDPHAGENAEVHQKAQWGEKIGSLKPENVSPEELVLVGGGAALLILM